MIELTICDVLSVCPGPRLIVTGCCCPAMVRLVVTVCPPILGVLQYQQVIYNICKIYYTIMHFLRSFKNID